MFPTGSIWRQPYAREEIKTLAVLGSNPASSLWKQPLTSSLGVGFKYFEWCSAIFCQLFGNFGCCWRTLGHLWHMFGYFICHCMFLKVVLLKAINDWDIFDRSPSFFKWLFGKKTDILDKILIFGSAITGPSISPKVAALFLAVACCSSNLM